MNDDQKLICAQEFVLVDSEGTPRGHWGIDNGGQAAMTFYDRNGKARMISGAGRDGVAVIRLNAADESPTAILTVDAVGDFRFACFDKSGNNRYQLTVRGDGAAIMRLGSDKPDVLLAAADGTGQIFINGTKYGD